MRGNRPALAGSINLYLDRIMAPLLAPDRVTRWRPRWTKEIAAPSVRLAAGSWLPVGVLVRTAAGHNYPRRDRAELGVRRLTGSAATGGLVLATGLSQSGSFLGYGEELLAFLRAFATIMAECDPAAAVSTLYLGL